MENKKFKWARRSEEWIKNNPGKGTMYRSDENGNEIIPGEPVKVLAQQIPEPYSNRREPAPKAGIYAVICEAEKYVYIGQSINTDVRMRNHRMNIIGNIDTTQSRYYIKMKEHAQKHGIDAFQFIKYKPMPEAGVTELLKSEGAAMLEFMENGYSLYNFYLSRDVINASVFCQEMFRPSIVKLIEMIRNEKISLSDLNNFIENVNKLTK